MLIEFNNIRSSFIDEKYAEKLDEIAREAIKYCCEEIEKLGDGINIKTLYELCSRMEKQISCVTFKSK